MSRVSIIIYPKNPRIASRLSSPLLKTYFVSRKPRDTRRISEERTYNVVHVDPNEIQATLSLDNPTELLTLVLRASPLAGRQCEPG